MSDAAYRLRRGRKVTARGELSLDRDEAWRKLRDFRLPDPHQYVLHLVRAASVLGATKIEFAVLPQTTSCVFDQAFADGELAELWNAPFVERDSPTNAALASLALAIGSAQALRPKSIEIETGRDRLVVREGDEELTQVSRKPRTRVIVREKYRFGHVVEFFESLTGRLAEEIALRERCEYSLLDVRVNGARVNTAFDPPGLPHNEEIAGDLHQVLAHPRFHFAKLVLLRDDVEVKRVVEKTCMVNAHAAHNSRRAPVDLTGLALGGEFDAFPTDLLGVYHRAVLQWAKRHREFATPARLLSVLRQLAGQLAGQTSDEVSAGTTEFVEWLLAQRLFASAVAGSDDRIVLRPEDGVVEYSTRPFYRLTSPTPIVLLLHNSRVIALLRWAGYETRDVTGDLATRDRRLRNETRWKRQSRRDPRRPDRHDPGERLVEHEHLRGFVDARKGQRGRGKIYFDGRVLFETESVLPFDVEVDGVVMPNEHFDNVTRDEVFDAFALKLIDAARDLFEQFEDHTADATLLLERVVSGTFDSDFLGLLGYGHREAAKIAPHDRATAGGYLSVARRAGPLFGAEIFENALGGYSSLRDIMLSDTTPVFFQTVTVPLPEGPGDNRDRLWLDLTSAQKRIVQTVRPAVGPSEAVFRREEALAKIDREEAFSEDELPEALFRRTIERDRYTVEMLLLDGKLVDGQYLSSLADILYLWRDRVVAREQWTSPAARWALIVRLDEVSVVGDTPGVDAGLVAECQRTFHAELETTLQLWSGQQTKRLRDLRVQMPPSVNAVPPTVQRTETTREREERVPTGERPRRDGALPAVSRLLRATRGDRADLLNDFTLAGFTSSDGTGEELCEVTADAVTVQLEHPLVTAVDDEIGRRFLASCIYTRINAYYATITDTDELEFQHRLLRGPR